MAEYQYKPTREKVKLVASTGDITTAATHSLKNENNSTLKGYFESAQWTADGTTLLTYSSTNLISGYLVPEDLLSPHDEPLTLKPQAQIQLPEASNVLAGAPYFSLAEPWTQQILASPTDHPIQLFSLAPPSSPSASPIIASYPFTKARSETILTATSLLWSSPGTHFIAGGRSLLARFDVHRSGEEPMLRIRTIPSERHISKGNGVGMRGTVSALGAQPTSAADQSGAGLIAAGTWTRWLGLYDFAQADACVATWSIAAAVRDDTSRLPVAAHDDKADDTESEGGKFGPGIGGDGITQTVWSPCGRYLVIAERKSRGALIYDVRVTGRLLGYTTGRDALGNQRIACDMFASIEGSEGFEIWSGSSSGAVRVWEGVGSREGPHEPSWEWSAHRSTVGSTCMHPSGTVVATCAGSWEYPNENFEEDMSEGGIESDSSVTSDESGSDSKRSYREPSWMRRRNRESSLKIWSTTSLQNDLSQEQESERCEK
ncbi:hypothetical protein F5Y16DRAFT_386891 [Xylariaceae sp. FL0255]|nr:hypothetical protein F5Y16DRAFT_386891 [Xylariaceae sp. FL0255]